jgi:hypothetical protein
MKYTKVKTQKELDAAIKGRSADEIIELIGDGYFEICGSSQVTAYGSSQVRAYDSSQVTAYDSSQVRAYGSSQVRAYDSSQVTAYGSSQVRAYDSSQVTAYGSSQVTAYGSSQVTAYGSSQVRAYDSSQVRAYGSSQVTASKQVAVTRHGKLAKVKGGLVIDYQKPSTVEEWCDNYGVEIKRGIAILYKIVRDDFKSAHGFLYQPGTTPEASDWDGGKAECGGGLHFSPHPSLARRYDDQGKRFVACPVAVKDIAVHKDAMYPDKVKARRICKPIYECDENGKAI